MSRRPVLWALCTLLAAGPVCHAQAQFGTPVAKAGAALVEKSYHVADLVTPVRMDLDAEKSTPKNLEVQLMDTIRTSVLPASWAGQGGQATMKYFPLGMSLVIRQTPEVHERIGALLAELRRAQDVEVSVEVRLLYLDEAGMERLPPLGDENDIYILTDRQVRQLLEAAQGERKVHIMQTPKLTVFNGQRIGAQVTQEQSFLTGVNVTKVNEQVVFTPKNETIETGLKYAVRPVVSADRRSIELSFNLSLTNLDGPVPLIPVQIPVPNTNGNPSVFQIFYQQPKLATTKVERLLKLPDGSTAVLYAGTVLAETRTEAGVPVLCKLPYISRLFRNVGYGRESQRLLVLVTPRVIVRQDGEPVTVGQATR